MPVKLQTGYGPETKKNPRLLRAGGQSLRIRVYLALSMTPQTILAISSRSRVLLGL